MSQAPECLRDVLRYCETHLNFSQTILIGHSLGAASSLQVAAWEQSNPESSVSGVVAMCMGNEPARGFDTPVGMFRTDFGIPGSVLPGASAGQPSSFGGGRWYFGIGHIF